MFLDVTSSLFIIVMGITLYFIFRKKPRNYPPGPMPLPIIGNVLSFGKEPHLALVKLFKKHGPILGFMMGSERAVFLHGAPLIKEAFNDPVFMGRPRQESAETFFVGGTDGIVLSQGPVWVEQRRFALRHLRDFGFGKTSMEGMIMSEVTELIEWLKGMQGKPLELHRRFTLAVINSLWTITSGERFAHDDAKLVQILDQFEATTKVMLDFGVRSILIMFYPGLAKMFPKLSGWNFLLKTVAPRRKLVEDTIEEHKRTLTDGHPRDFIDVFLQTAKKSEDPDSIFCNNPDKYLQSLLDDLFFAGTDTSSTTLSWAVLYLMHYTNVQDKLREEIDRVVGKSRLPCLADKISMPFTEAFIMEVLRKSSILSNGVGRCALQDTEFHGYFIPKGAILMSSLYTTHHDPEVWGDPENFRPERFLNEDGTKVQKHESLLAFSTGKRACIGESMAKDNIFLFITSLVQTFDILSEPGKPKPTLAAKQATTLQPHPYSVILKERL